MAEPFENAPEMGQQFQEAQQREEPQELNFDPPEQVWDHNRVVQPSPTGNIDVTVVKELDPNAQKAIQDVQNQRDEFEQRMVERFNQQRQQNHGPQR